MELPWWRHDGAWFQVSPWAVLAQPSSHPEHWRRINQADLAHPLHVLRRRRRWLILDGIHRLAKAELLARDQIDVLALSPTDLERIALRGPKHAPRARPQREAPGCPGATRPLN